MNTSNLPGPGISLPWDRLYLEWVRQNGGLVELDESAKIKNAPIYQNLSPNLISSMEMIRAEKWAKAYSALMKSKGQDDALGKSLLAKVNANVTSHLEAIEAQGNAGDAYGVYVKFQKFSKNYKGIPAYDEVFKKYGVFFKKDENKAALKVGREFHDIINRINKVERANTAILAHVEKFMNAHADTAHGKAAKKAYDSMTEDSTVKRPAGSYYLDGK